MKVLTLLNSKNKWIKGNLATNEKGDKVFPNSRRAIKFCLLGAIHRCYSRDRYERDKAIVTVEYEIFKMFPRRKSNFSIIKSNFSIILFNDSPRTTFRDIQKVLKKANV